MNRLPDVSHQRVIRSLERAGFVVKRQGQHVFMYSQERRKAAVIPRQNPVKRATLAQILKDIGLSPQEFADLL